MNLTMHSGAVVSAIGGLYAAVALLRRKTRYRATVHECAIVAIGLILVAIVWPAVYGTSK